MVLFHSAVVLKTARCKVEIKKKEKPTVPMSREVLLMLPQALEAFLVRLKDGSPTLPHTRASSYRDKRGDPAATEPLPPQEHVTTQLLIYEFPKQIRNPDFKVCF